MDLSTIEAVLFDMDGTLVDSDAAVERAWRVWAGEYGADPTTVLAVAHGAPAERTVRLIRPDLEDAAVAQAAARQLALQYDDLSDVVATPGAHALLAALRVPWAVVTSADARLAEARLKAAGPQGCGRGPADRRPDSRRGTGWTPDSPCVNRRSGAASRSGRSTYPDISCATGISWFISIMRTVRHCSTRIPHSARSPSRPGVTVLRSSSYPTRYVTEHDDALDLTEVAPADAIALEVRAPV